MLGRSCLSYGSYQHGRCGRGRGYLSAGSDPQSPSLSFKASKHYINEDALLIKRSQERYLLAVADGHFGLTTSHSLISRLAEMAMPESREELQSLVHAAQLPMREAAGGSTLTVVLVDPAVGLCQGVYTGDSRAVTIHQNHYHQLTEDNQRYLYLHRPLEEEEWSYFAAPFQPGALLLVFTDGINECHYRSPKTSIQPCHLTNLWEQADQEVERFGEGLMGLALGGVEGNPGGQDNIALIALKRPEEPGAGV